MCFASRLIQDSLVNESRDQLAFSPVHITENSHEEAMIFGTILSRGPYTETKIYLIDTHLHQVLVLIVILPIPFDI